MSEALTRRITTIRIQRKIMKVQPICLPILKRKGKHKVWSFQMLEIKKVAASPACWVWWTPTMREGGRDRSRLFPVTDSHLTALTRNWWSRPRCHWRWIDSRTLSSRNRNKNYNCKTKASRSNQCKEIYLWTAPNCSRSIWKWPCRSLSDDKMQ